MYGYVRRSRVYCYARTGIFSKSSLVAEESEGKVGCQSQRGARVQVITQANLSVHLY